MSRADRRCKATSKRTGKRCGATAAVGALVCKWHGANSPQGQRGIARRLAVHEAEVAATRLGLLIDTTPEQALLDEVQRCAGMVEYYGARVQEVEHDDPRHLIFGLTREKHGGDDEGTTYEAVPSVWLQLWNAERDRLVKACAAAIRAGIEERRVKLAEQQGALVAAVIRRILDRLNLTDAQQGLVATVVPEELRAIVA